MNTDHLDALISRLTRERERARTDPSEIRDVWIAQLEREIASEYQFLGIKPNISDDDLLEALLS